MSLFDVFIIAALATYRLTFMLNSESGPGDIFVRLRSRLGVKFDQYSNPYGTNWISEGVLCFYCLSVWVGFAVYFWLYIFTWLRIFQFGAALLFPFALSGVAVYLKKAVG
jgi:hypothetical protein